MRGFISSTQPGRSNTAKSAVPEIAASSEIACITRTIEAGGVGRMHFRATYWNARSADGAVILKGTVVRPIKRIGNTWYVVAEGQISDQQAA